MNARQGVLHSSERFRELIEWLPAVVYEAEVDPRAEWHYVSPQIEDMLGYSPEEWLADPDLWEKRLHPDDRQEVVDLERREAEIGRSGTVTMVSEYRMLHRDGSVVWVRDEARVATGRDGRPQWRGVLIDITEARTAERALSETVEMYRGLVNSLPVCVYQADPLARDPWELVSPQMAQMLGFTDEEWAREQGLWESRLHPEDAERVLREQERHMTMPPGTPSTSEYRVMHRSGAVVWVRDRAVVAERPDGRRVIDGILTDVTAERQTADPASSSSDVLRLTCRGCGAVRAAQRVEPCPECGSADIDALSLEAALAELAATRSQMETLLDGVHKHLEALGRKRPEAGQLPPRGDERRIVTRTSGSHAP